MKPTSASPVALTSTPAYTAWMAALPPEARGDGREDADTLQALMKDKSRTVAVRVNATAGAFGLRIFSRHAQLTLAEMMPVIHSFRLESLREDVVALDHKDGKVWLHVITCAVPSTPVHDSVAREVEEAMALCLMGKAEVNSLNSLVRRGLPFRALNVLRGLIAYAQQVDARSNPWLMRTVLRHYPKVAVHLWQLFEAMHDPEIADHARTKLIKQIETKTRDVWMELPDVDHDRMASLLLETVRATVRTNFFQGGSEAFVFKMDCSRMPSLPKPLPWREIFVYGGNEFEGIHLRGGPLARGGIRHSDRLTDYRIEVLGLQQTQVRKNVIIVPTGAKGGFVVKFALPPQRDEAHTAIRNVYAAYVRAMLSITDNMVGEKVVHPRKVVCHDGFDPYFVMAADKGTATFSDLANATGMAADFWDMPKGATKGFWLGDAFASGGSNGYDHKGMGITSRGAWVSVVHHLKALEIVPSDKRPITMVGIGDMSGDVFGNGLLRTPFAKLLGAFNHKHIFLDPSPTPKVGFAERQRMFDAKLGWDGYDVKKLSKGGGIYRRDAKEIEISPEAAAMLGLDTRVVRPDAVIQAILTMDVDVLWNGGIGTYIKASSEAHVDVNDRANDGVRVDGNAVRAKVIGEGGNLGISPKGRVELAMCGVKLNTDAMDNSAGVSTSDHEVNVKILLEDAKRRKKLDEAGRLKILPTLEEDIAHLVLADNALQNMAITLAEMADTADHVDMALWQQELMKRGVVDVKTDNLPTEAMLKARAKPHYTRPELAGLLAGSKRALREQIAGKLPYDQPLLHEVMMGYFPAALQKKFGDVIPHFPLKEELMDTLVTNMVVNRCGLVMGQRLQADLGCTPPDAIAAILVAIGLLDLVPFWESFDAASETLPMATQVDAAMRWRVSIFTLAGWVLAHGQPVDVAAWFKGYKDDCGGVMRTMARNLPERMRADIHTWQDQWEAQGLPRDLAAKLGLLSASTMVPQAAMLAKRHKMPLPKVLELFMNIGDELHMQGITRKLRGLPITDKYSRSAMFAMEREVQARQASLTEQLLRAGKKADVWHRECGLACQRYQTLAKEFLALEQPDLAMAAVLLGRLRELDVK